MRCFSVFMGSSVAMQGVPGAQSGLASGLLNVSRLMGGALGLAILSTIAAGQTGGQAGVGAARALSDRSRGRWSRRRDVRAR